MIIKANINNILSMSNTINFFKYENGSKYWDDIISIPIKINSKPKLELNCYTYDTRTEFYEYVINYIINNKIGKYNNMDILYYTDLINQDYNIFIYFDIIDKELLLKFI